MKLPTLEPVSSLFTLSRSNMSNYANAQSISCYMSLLPSNKKNTPTPPSLSFPFFLIATITIITITIVDIYYKLDGWYNVHEHVKDSNFNTLRKGLSLPSTFSFNLQAFKDAVTKTIRIREDFYASS